ncbi:hypothetical protein RRG08_010096 [Elysia crispata]|nr:hypothetical protein RRG08_010096 [Elysia crispata]
MIAGDTQTLLKDTTHRSFLHVRVKCSTDDRPEKEIAFFNVHNYLKAVQIQVPFHIQMILGKPWFCRTNKEVETAVKFLEKMRCFTAYPRPFQFMLARVAWYLELPTQKVVIRQSQQAVNFYLLLNGTVKIDRLEGSSCDKENGHFVTLRVLSSQDMFGDECVTQPFSERWYTATTEEKCAALDFNMHDYNNMIQTANTSEEAPDHIRFLCKLRIMDNFPKIKLLREQDNNVTYFFFRPGTLVCRSVRESPFIFVVRNGSCAVLQELKPRIPTDRRSKIQSKSLSLISTPGASGVTIDSFSSNLGGVAKMSRSFQGSKIFDDFPNRSSGDGKDWFEKTRASFDQSKLGISDSIRNIKDKAELITKTLSTEHLERFNLEDKSKPEEYPIRRSIGSRASLRWKLQESPTQEGGMSSTSFTDLEIGKKLSGSFSGRLTLGNDMVSSDIQSKRSKIVGTNIQLTPDKIINERKLSQSWSSNLNNSARSRQNVALATIREPTTSTRQGSRLSKTSALPVSGGKNLSAVPMSGGRNSSAVPMSGGRNSSAVPMSASRKSVAARGEADYPLSKYSQWTQKALLTVTDVAGVDWLDYNDGTYNPPKEDTSLISHGATIIMIKKDFMLKYLRRTW